MIVKVKYPHPPVSDKYNLIIETVCNYYGLTFKEICAHSRKRHLVFPRQIIMGLLYCNFPMYSSQFIADQLGFDRTMVNHAIMCLLNAKDVNDILWEDYLNIVDLLGFPCAPVKLRAIKDIPKIKISYSEKMRNERLRFIKLYQNKMNVTDMAKHLKCSRLTIYNYLKQLS